MSKTLTEKQVLKKLGIPDFRHLSKEKVMKFATMLPHMDPEVAKKALEQFPEFAKTTKEMLVEYKDILEKGMASNDKSIMNCYDAGKAMISSLQKELDKEELSDSKLSDYKEKYPLIEDEPLYEIKDINEDERKELEDILKKPMVALMAFDSSEDMKDQIKTQLLSNMPEQAQAMYNDKDVFDILKTLPQEAVSGMKESMDEKLDEMQDSILDQSAVSYVKSEYEKI